MIDSHAHVMFDDFDADRGDVITRAQAAGVAGWIEVGTDLAQSRKAVALAQQHTNVWASVGVHPSDIAGVTEKDWQEMEKLLTQPHPDPLLGKERGNKVIAVGEVGLDYYRGGTDEDQLPVLRRFVDLALQHNLPVIFHVRDPVKSPTSDHGASAHAALIKFLQSLSKIPQGVIHTYSGTLEQAKQYLELGMYLSFSGVITFKNAGELLEIAKQTPLDRMLIETDCPFLAPEPYRGKRNEPSYVKYVAQKIAELRGISLAEVQEATIHNTVQLFKI